MPFIAHAYQIDGRENEIHEEMSKRLICEDLNKNKHGSKLSSLKFYFHQL